MNDNKTAVAGRVIPFPCFLVGELEPTQGHMARGENGPEHSAPAPGLVLAPGLPAFPGENGSFQEALHLLTWAMSMKRPALNSHYNIDHP